METSAVNLRLKIDYTIIEASTVLTKFRILQFTVGDYLGVRNALIKELRSRVIKAPQGWVRAMLPLNGGITDPSPTPFPTPSALLPHWYC